MDYIYTKVEGIDMEATGRKIGMLISDSGLTDKKFGEKMGLSVQAINKWRHGHTLPDIDNLFILSRIFGIKVDDFLVPKANLNMVIFEKEPEVDIISTSANYHLGIYLEKTKGNSKLVE